MVVVVAAGMADEPAHEELDATVNDITTQPPKSHPKKINLKLKSHQPKKEKHTRALVEAMESSSSDDDLPPPPPPPRTKSPQRSSSVKSTPEKSGGEDDILATYGMMDTDAPFEEWTNKVNIIGYKVADPLIYTCELCDQPVLIYGRLLPCKHVFCYPCAEKTVVTNGSKCVRNGCETAVAKLERAQAGSVYVCTFGTAKQDHKGCRRTYLSERDLQAHIDHRHIKAPKKPKTKSKTVKKEQVICADPMDPRYKLQDYVHHKSPVLPVPAPDSISTSVPPPNVVNSTPVQNTPPPIVAGQFAIQPSRSANLITIPIQEERKMNPYAMPPPVIAPTNLTPRGVPPPYMQPPVSTPVPVPRTIVVQAPPNQMFQNPPPNVLPPGAVPPPNQRPPGPPPQLPQGPRIMPPVISHYQPGGPTFSGPWMSQAGGVSGQPVQPVSQVMTVPANMTCVTVPANMARAPPPHLQGMPGQPHPGQQPHPSQPPHMSQTNVPLPNTSVPPPHIRLAGPPPPFYR